MMAKRYHVSRHIDAPVERVWALLTDASSYRAWNRAVVSIEGPITEGATISLVSIVNPKRTFKLKVTEMTPPTRMVWGDGMPWACSKASGPTGWRRLPAAPSSQ